MTRLVNPPWSSADGRSHTVVTAIGLLGAAGTMALGGSRVGLLFGGAFLLVGFAVSPLLAFTVGQVLLLGSLETAPLLRIGVAQAALATILVGEIVAQPGGDATAALYVALGILLVGVTIGLVLATSILTGALLFGGGVATIAYLFHRYELLQLGLIEVIDA